MALNFGLDSSGGVDFACILKALEELSEGDFAKSGIVFKGVCLIELCGVLGHSQLAHLESLTKKRVTDLTRFQGMFPDLRSSSILLIWEESFSSRAL